MLHLYYTDLIELTAALVFLVVLKIVLLYAMNRVGAVISDEPKPARKPDKPRLPGFLNRMRWSLGILLVLNGLWQIRPIMLFVSADRLIRSGSSRAVAHWWVSNANWLNIWSVLITLAFAALLLSFAQPIMVRIFASLFTLYAITAWIWLVALHDWTAVPVTFLVGLPGASLLLAVASLPLIFQGTDWKPFFRIASNLYWVCLAVLQVIPGNGFWSGQGYAQMAQMHPADAPHSFVLFDGRLQAFASAHALVMTVLLVIIACGIAAGWLWSRSGTASGVVGIIVLVLVWLCFDEAGFGGAYVFALGSAPVVILWMLFARFYRTAADHL